MSYINICDECNLIEDEFHVIMVCTRYIDILTDAMNAISLIDYQNQNQNQNNFISETYNVSNIKINLLLMGANSWKPI